MNIVSYSAAEVFDKVKNHLLNQNLRCAEIELFVSEHEMKEKCVYRRLDGLKCAIGCLIPDNMYRKWMEQYSIESLCRGVRGGEDGEYFCLDVYRKYRGEVLSTHDQELILQMLSDLQFVHDSVPPDRWEGKLKQVWNEYYSLIHHW